MTDSLQAHPNHNGAQTPTENIGALTTDQVSGSHDEMLKEANKTSSELPTSGMNTHNAESTDALIQNPATESQKEDTAQKTQTTAPAKANPKNTQSQSRSRSRVKSRKSAEPNKSSRGNGPSSNRDKTRRLRRHVPMIKQTQVVLDPNTTVHLDSKTSTRVIRVGDDAWSKCVVTVSVTLYSQAAQRLLERNFQHVSWSADKISEYIQRNLRNKSIVQFEELVDQESSRIAQQLDEGIAFFGEHVRNLDDSIKRSVHYTRPVQYDLPVESNSATRFVRLVLQFDQLCQLLDILTISDGFGDGANVKLAHEIRKWRKIVNGMTNLIIGTQREARKLILSSQSVNNESQALLEAAKVAEDEEKVFGRNGLTSTESLPLIDDAIVVEAPKDMQSFEETSL